MDIVGTNLAILSALSLRAANASVTGTDSSFTIPDACVVVRVTPASTARITGIDAPPTARVVVLVNISTTETLTLVYDDNNVDAAHIVLGGSETEQDLLPGQSFALVYDLTTAAWRPLVAALGTGGGSGTVTSVGTGRGLTGGAITTTGTIDAAIAVNTQTGTTYTVEASDGGKLVTFANGSAIAVTLPQATSSFGAGWYFYAANTGTGTATITPTTSTIDGATTLVLRTGASALIVSDGTNYHVVRSKGDVVGPASSTNGALAVFDGATGKLIDDSTVVFSTTGWNAILQFPDPGHLRANPADGAILTIQGYRGNDEEWVNLLEAVSSDDNPRLLLNRVRWIAGTDAYMDIYPGMENGSKLDISAWNTNTETFATFITVTSGDPPTLTINNAALTGTPTAPTATTGTNTTQVATTAFVLSELSAAVQGLLKLKGNLDASANPNYPSASKGDTYYVTVAGKVGGASGVDVEIGDAVIAKADNAGGTEASVGTSWFVLQKNLHGALVAANNLSDVANASTARTNLGLAIGTNVQAYSSQLAAIAGLSPSNDDIIQRKSGAWTNRTMAQLAADLAIASQPSINVSGVRLELGGYVEYGTGDNPSWVRGKAPLVLSGASVNTSTDLMTVTAHGLGKSGTRTAFRSSTTSAGLSTGTTYWVKVIDANTLSFHTSINDALNDIRVDLTGNYTGTLFQVEMTLVPYHHHFLMIEGVYRTAAGASLSLVGLSASTVYDVFAYWNGSAVVLEAVGWTSSTTRATDLARDTYGVLVKSGDTSRTYVGTIYIDSSGYVYDSNGLRQVWNAYNQIEKPNNILLGSSSAYGTNTYAECGGSGAMSYRCLAGMHQVADIVFNATALAGGSAMNHGYAIGYDSSTDGISGSAIGQCIGAASTQQGVSGRVIHTCAPGWHTYRMLHIAYAGVSATSLPSGRTAFAINWRC